MMSEYNPEYCGTAYYCGALMALYVAIQNAAMPEVNAGVEERYYSSAIQTPALVIGRLSRLSVHHLHDLDGRNRWLADYYRKQLESVYAALEGSIPTTLNLEQQTEFALGFYQKRAEIYKGKDKED